MLRLLSRQPLTNTTASLSTLAMMTVSKRTVYSALVQEHFDKPRNIGSMKASDPTVGSATVGAPECGDMARIQIKVNEETGIIEDTKIKVYGCGSAIASTSFVSEKLKGKTISEALEITNKDIAAELSLPPVKLHCSLLAEEAIKASVANYLQKNPQLKSKVKRNSSAAVSP